MERRDFNKMLLACGALAAFGVSPAPRALAQHRDGGLTAILQPEPPILNLALNQQTPTGVVGGKIFESLLSYDFDLQPMPQLAESWEISEDGKTYTFRLVKNAKWHDGEPFTAADVVFSCANLLMEVHPRARANFDRCESIKARDDHTVVFTLKEPFAPFILAFEASSAPILPKHLYEGQDYRNSPYNNKPVGTGPFKFSEWVRGSHIHLTAFPDYYQEGKPHLTEIYYRIVPDAASRAVAMETGEAQLAQWMDIETFDVERLAALDHLTMTTKGYELFSPVLWIEINNRREPMNDKRFRQALMHLTDKKFVAERIMFGLAKPATGPIASTTRFFESDVKQYELSVEKATALLDEIGLKPDSDGKRITLRFAVAPYGEMWVRTAEYFRQAVAPAGIEVILDSYDIGGWASAISNWDFDLTTNMLYQYGDPALGVARTYISSNIRKGVMFSNTSGYSNPDIDRLFDEAAVETSDARRQELYSEAQRILVEDAPLLWLTEQRYPTIYDARIENLITTSTGVNGNFAAARYAE
ncbi:ABC transporter substrate-binding protein [Nitratireductor aquibiodomus]|uniref:ABC transporter substrate-binding protein n=1 Tax=Nitratireductor aquibiodomus TaxID=204799 RepID=UPI0004683E33|nr:ABC transporter substrate-binding protein [Nitratireductor aquibiodomus]